MSLRQYSMRSIEFLENTKYLLGLVDGGGNRIDVVCRVIRDCDSELDGIDVIRFESPEFNRLCAHGCVYVRPIAKAVLAFHECFDRPDF